MIPSSKRAYYLDSRRLEEASFTLDYLKSFEGGCLINASLDLDESRFIPIDKKNAGLKARHFFSKAYPPAYNQS